MRYSLVITAILLLLLACGCKEMEPVERDFPQLSTFEVADISENGARFNAEIFSGSHFEIIEYGFTWSEDKNPEIGWAEKVIFSGNVEGRKFSADITTTLKEDIIYYVSAFLRTDKYIVYGNVVAFRSLGSKAPVLNYFHPVSGTWGDTIQIIGKNFSYILENNAVKFGTVASKILLATDTALYVTIPAVENGSQVFITVSVLGNFSISELAFEYLVPEVHEIKPLHGGFFDTIRVFGKNFNHNPLYSSIYFGNHKAEIIYLSNSLIHTFVPAGLNTANSQIKVKSIGIEVLFDEPFTLNPPEITGFEPEEITKYEEIIKIHGKHFSPVRSNNHVQVEGISAQIIAASIDHLIIKTPAQVIPNYNVSTFKDVTLEVTVFNQTDMQKIDVNWHSIWTKKNNFPGTARGNAVAFTIGSIGYIGTGIVDPWLNVTNDFWKYDPEQDTWEPIASLPGEARGNAVAFTLNNHAYVGLGRNKDVCFNDFYKYYPDDDIWVQIADFPGIPRHSSACFVINNEAWIGTGYSTTGNTSPTTDFYKFNPINNSWSQEIDFSRTTGRAVGFSINNTAYMYDFNALLRLVSGKWWQLNTPILNTFENAAFLINDKAYFGLGRNNQGSSTALWEYDPTTQKFSNKPLPVSEKRSGVAAFTISDKAYVVGGLYTIAYWNSVWEFDPTKPEN